MSAADLTLVAIVTLAFTTEAAIGFGGTLIVVSLGSLLSPVDAILHAFVPCNVVLSAVLTFRARRHVNGRALLLRILPAMVLGLPVGLFALARLPRPALQIALGIFVLALGAIELARLLRARVEESPRPLPRALELALLFAGGVAQGAFGAAGPPVVYVCGRTMTDKRAFRATLSALWLLLNLMLVVAYVRAGDVNAASLRRTATLAPGLLLGLGLGEVAHGRLPDRTFRIAVFAMLVVVGAALAIRA